MHLRPTRSEGGTPPDCQAEGDFDVYLMENGVERLFEGVGVWFGWFGWFTGDMPRIWQLTNPQQVLGRKNGRWRRMGALIRCTTFEFLRAAEVMPVLLQGLDALSRFASQSRGLESSRTQYDMLNAFKSSQYSLGMLSALDRDLTDFFFGVVLMLSHLCCQCCPYCKL